MIFNWLRKRLGGTSVSKEEESGVLGLGDPPRVVSQSAYVRGAGGGKCSQCESFANVIHDDGKCSRCTTSGVIVPEKKPPQGDCRRR